jgi:hypothetical protein
VIFIDNKEIYSEQQNRVLESFPSLIIDNKLNTQFITQFDTYIQDRFWLHDYFVAINNSINFYLLKKAGNNRVIRGKDGWLFLLDDYSMLRDYEKTNLFSENELENLYYQIQARSDWCEENGIKFIFLITPNKHSIYPEYYPFKRPDGLSRAEQLMVNLPDSLKDKVVFLQDYLLSKKEKSLFMGGYLYYETDTHWNKRGAYHGYVMLQKKVEYIFPDIQFENIGSIKVIESIPKKGDLVYMLGLKTYGSSNEVIIEPESGWEAFFNYKENKILQGEYRTIVSENKVNNLPRIIIFGDSFFHNMQPFISCQFSALEYSWKIFEETDKDYILEMKPDIIVWQMVERGISSLPFLQWN